MPAARPAPKPSPASIPAVFVIAVLVAAGSAVFGYPGLLALPVGVIVAAFIAPPAELTGKKDSSGFPTAASPGETRAMNRYRMWGDLKVRALLPSIDWLPGNPVRLWWIISVLLAGIAACLPTVAVGDAGRVLNGLGVFMLINSVNGALRRWTAPDDPCPGPTAKDVLAAIGNGKKIIVALVGAGVIFVAVFIAALLAFNLPVVHPYVTPVPPVFPALGLALTAAVTIITLTVRSDALAHWRTMVSVRAEWEPRWEMVKVEYKPRLLNHEQVGAVAVDTFEAHPTIGFAGVLGVFPKLGQAMGTAQRLALLECPSTDSQGQPIEGTQHPRQLRILTFDTDAMPNVLDPDTPQEQIDLRIAAAASWVSDSDGSGRWVFGRAEPLHTPDSETAAWFVEFYTPAGPPYEYMRTNNMGAFSDQVGAQVLMSHRDVNRAIYIGDLTSGTTVFADEAITQELRNLTVEDEWSQRWKNALKMDAVRPRPEHGVYQEAKVGAIALYRQPFVVQQGLDPSEYFKLEPKLATTLSAAPFVSVTGFTNAAARREGERHVQAFSVTWCDPMKAVPQNPDQLRPEDGNGPLWVLQGRMNEAFDAAKLQRPEVYAVRPLTESRSRGHIWEMKLRLYRGVTLGDVRSAAQRIRGQLNSDWLRVAEASDGIVIVAGSDPHTTRGLVYAGAGAAARTDDDRPRRPGAEDRASARPTRSRRPAGGGSEPDPELEKRNRDYVTALDWEQAFYNAKVIGVAGDLPKLSSTATLPNNEAVAVLDFKLPAGTSRGYVREAVPVLMAATGNSFVEPRESPLGADYARLLVSRDHPLPDRAGFKWDVIDNAAGIPFASGIEGEPIEYDPVDNPHILLAGVTGSGKSVLAQAFIYGALIRNADLYVIDPVKGGADFNFAKEHSKAFASTAFEAAAVMKCVYAEVIRRKNINADAGVGSFLDLKDPYNRIFVMIDEFTSLMGQDPVPPTSEDPEAEAERELIIATNRAKVDVGVFAGKIAREARSAGVHLMLGTQKLTAKLLDTLPGANDLKTNLARTLLGKTSQGDRASALRAFQDAPDLGGDIPKGRGLYEPLTSSAIAVQVWYATQDELHTELLKRRPVLNEADRADLSPYLPKVANATPSGAPRSASEPLPPTEVKVAEVSFTIDALNAAAGVTPAAPTPEPAPTTEEPMTTELGWLFDQHAAVASQASHSPEPEAPTTHPTGPMQPAYDDIVEAAPDTPLTTPPPAASPAPAAPVEPAPAPPAARRPLVVVDPAVPVSPALSAVGDVFILPARQAGESDAFGWWKLHPVIKTIYTAPGTGTVIWIDPELAHVAPSGQQYAHVVHAALASIGITVHLAVDPAQLFGATPAAPAPVQPTAAATAHTPSTTAAPVTPSPVDEDFMVQPPTRATMYDELF